MTWKEFKQLVNDFPVENENLEVYVRLPAPLDEDRNGLLIKLTDSPYFIETPDGACIENIHTFHFRNANAVLFDYNDLT
jgi:hypothetical protein